MKEATEYILSLRSNWGNGDSGGGSGTICVGGQQSVLANTTNPGSALKTKCAAVAYHLVHEAVARDEIIKAYPYRRLMRENHRDISIYISHPPKP